ncbi:MAG: hypothetical protein IJF32_00830 [Oscillospiraceae bacterium]|nr:hypothetical protein [Oscillospiraceae bacterium]
MKARKILSAIMAIAMIAAFAVSASAAEEVVLPSGITVDSFGDNTVTDGTNYYLTLQAAVEAICGKDGAALYCKPSADVGSLQHAPVTTSLTVYGNGAYVSGGSERDFDIGNTDPNGGKDITADMTLTVKNLDGCGAWGAKATEHTVNLVFENCDNMGKVFISGTTGVLNITITDSSFGDNDNGGGNCKVYSNANGTVSLTRVAFENVDKAVNLNHKVAGTQTVVLDGCTFTNCGDVVADDEIPVRVLSSVEGGESKLTVSGCSFSGTPEGGADILLDYGVGTTVASVETTAANILEQNETDDAQMIAVTENESFTNAPATPVAKIGDVEYATIQAAVNAAEDDDTIIVAAGNHNVFCPVGSADNATGRAHNLFINKNITIKGDGSGEVNIYSYQEAYTSTFDARITVLISGTDGVVIDGLNIYPSYYPTSISTNLDTVSGSLINEVTGQSELKFYYNQIIDAMRSYNGTASCSETYIANITVKNCTIGDTAIAPENWGCAIYYPGAVGNATNFAGLTGGYTIEKNTLYGSICICEGAAKDATAETCIIRDNILYDAIILNGKRPTGWNHVSLTIFPTITGNTFKDALWTVDGKNYFISSRDGDESAVIPKATLEAYVSANTFETDAQVAALVGSYAYSETATEYYGLVCEQEKTDVIDPAFGTTLGVARIGANETDYELVVLGAIDSLNYKDVGFEITLNDEVYELKTKTVYTKITSTDAETNEVQDYTSKELGGAENGYVFGQMLGFAFEDMGKDFTCRLFAINLNDEYIYGKTWEVPVSE